jgi:uncharacterized repeat protein (TIGR03847 family)
MVIELDPVDRITADAVGEPGSRAFYLQGRKDDHIVTLLLEKQQVQLLAASVVEILARVGKETGQGPPEEAMTLEEPIVPEWRAGRLSIGYREDRDMLMLEVEELVPEEGEGEGEGEEEEDEGEGQAAEPPSGLEAIGPELRVRPLPEEPEEGEETSEEPEELHPDLDLEEDTTLAARERIRFWATREQMLSLARHGAIVCAAGRPVCQLCGNSIDPEGHHCPALNGHREMSDG